MRLGAVLACALFAAPAGATVAQSLVPELIYAAAGEAQGKGDFARSLELLEQLDAAHADHKLAGFLAAYALQKLGKDQPAIARYRTFLATHPTFAQARFNLAFALMQTGSYQQAAAEFQRTLEVAPDYWEVHLHLGRCLEKLGDHQAAAHELRIWERK